MTWTVAWLSRANRDVEKLPADVAERVVSAVTRWAASDHGDIRVAQNMGRATHRLRAGQWRVLLALDPDEQTATILRVLPRGSAYKQ